MPIFKIHHLTKYQYNRPVKESCNSIIIYPYNCLQQEVLQHDVIITNQPDVQIFTDYWGNKVGLFNVIAPHIELIIESKLTIRTLATNDLAINAQANWQQLSEVLINNFKLIETATPELIEKQEEIKKIVHQLQFTTKTVAQTVEAASEYIFKYFKYIKGITTVETTVDEVLEQRAGVCQDFAHVLLQILRTIGVPCRYVSGYICPNKNGMRGEGATHAWVEAFIPNFGWAGIDPTNNVWVANTHVVLAIGKNFNDCSPVKGTFKGPAYQKLSVYVSIGYEDGQVFEEINNVKMEEIISTEKEKYLFDSSYQQQQ